MKLVVQEFLTLDGVSQGPGAPDEDTSDGFTRGGWFVPHLDEAFERLAGEWLAEADAFLFGRRTYENFARDWPRMTDHPFAGILNGLPKYVASNALTAAGATWNPTTILSGDVPAQVAALKRHPGRDLQIHGSARLTQSLLAAGLVDELRLAIAPVVLGEGRRLFPAGSTPTGLHLTEQRTTPAGVSVHIFTVTGTPDYATYGARE
ncbi:deaminase [Streptomyces sp. CB02130]|uniref:dihydrofolate reductase family protein n=1 Tax=Streptomyces sp. CB02130 TaxID=1703934 RepID=UPI00093E71FF|nr:dihydrofolate reductase family protein [Streptomyces sp. CB02130]OKJ24237.1 deaminase [Streptomyces sp. CB02130]